MYHGKISQNTILKAKTNCDTLYILLNEKEFEELNHQRRALNDNKDFNYVKGNILNNDTSKIKIKLKGDRFVHFENETGGLLE